MVPLAKSSSVTFRRADPSQFHSNKAIGNPSGEIKWGRTNCALVVLRDRFKFSTFTLETVPPLVTFNRDRTVPSPGSGLGTSVLNHCWHVSAAEVEVAVRVGVFVGVAVEVHVAVREGVLVGVAVGISVKVGVTVAVKVLVAVLEGV